MQPDRKIRRGRAILYFELNDCFWRIVLKNSAVEAEEDH
jgi:hypothetical protein